MVASELAVITARSLSSTSQVIRLVQSRPLPSIQRFEAFLRATCATLGGVGSELEIAGEKPVPAFGGGLAPAYGPFLLFTVVSGMMVLWLPDSKMARYTFEPSGLTAMARGEAP